MSLSNILEWGFLFFLVGIGIYTSMVIKNEKIEFKHRALRFKKYKILIPEIWREVSCQIDNDYHFKNYDLNDDWECHFILIPIAVDCELNTTFENIITTRKIVFDEFEIFTPTILDREFDILRIEGTATVDKIERHYCDCFIIREKYSDTCLYAESRGPILNGFLMALSFEETVRSIKLV